ncbi:MAG TPA: THUMP domain-containing protein [Candidatus Nanoarchaeia archaeon]|nr:THUMP domain-containing protein [Candidatus Nanoarchaeia archaeon]
MTMKLIALVNPGMEELCRQEIPEIINAAGKDFGKKYPHLIEFESSGEQALQLLHHGQSLRRLLVSLTKCKNIDDLDFNSVAWKEYLPTTPALSFKVEVENVKGMDNRLDIARKVAGKVFAAVEKQKLPLTIDLKKPDFLLMVYFNGKEYFLGIDLAGEELHSRAYRVFTHSASSKGDLGYYFVRKTGYKRGNSFLIEFAKDGVIAIEAALYASRMPVHSAASKFSYKKLPLFQSLQYLPLISQSSTSIAAVDEGSQNVTAARKNAQIAGVRNFINLQKIPLDELSGAFHEQEFDQILFQVTTKDEEKLNEIYHQTKYLLKPKGTLLLIGRESWEISTPSYCKLVSEEVLERGENKYKLWLMQRK